MNITGLITEYNPFHNGHSYHLVQAKKASAADFLIVVMSGNFTQRGALAVIDKYKRCRMALEAGADLVLELPVPFAAGSAEIFSQAAVSLLDSLGLVTHICFGSETSNLSYLSLPAKICFDEPEEFQFFLKQSLQAGNNFAKARMEALISYITQTSKEASSIPWQDILSSPNNILGIEYQKALYRLDSPITPISIPRIQAAYHDESITHSISSATAIRKQLENAPDWNLIQSAVPPFVYSVLRENYLKTFPIHSDDCSDLLNYSLLTQKNFSDYAELSEELSFRLNKLLPDCKTLEEWCDCLKTKAYTHSRIRRALLHLILQITKADMDIWKTHNYCYYARVLGFREDSLALLSYLKKSSSVPLLTKMAKASSLLPFDGQKLLDKEILSSHIYRQLVWSKFHTLLPDEYRAGIIKYPKSSAE